MNELNTTESTIFIDRRSYILGMITAFAECVANESKKLALSPPFYPTDYENERKADHRGYLRQNPSETRELADPKTIIPCGPLAKH